MSVRGEKLNQWSDLKKLKHDMALQAEQEAQREAARLAAVRLAQERQELFSRAVGPVLSLKAKKTAHLVHTLPAPIPTQRQNDERAVLREALSDEWDTSSLLDTDEALSFRRPGVGADVIRNLRRGEWSIQKELDLHDLRTDEAREALGQFIRSCHKQGVRCVRVVHGKGLGSPGKVSVLRPKVQSWLIQKNQVLAFVQATPSQGGAGALVVLLQAGEARLARSLNS
jgi:DNA-nicking Smr family endonuclease